METNPVKLNYAVYARKSSEQEDRQAASIESQINELKQIAKRDGLTVTVFLEESFSAKVPGRPVFNQLVELIHKGKVNALLVWHPNRISRNIMDLATLDQLMNQKKLLEVRTPSQIFRCNVPMEQFMLLFGIGQAKLENDNKGIDVKRGLKSKVDKGICPIHAPIGYINDPLAPRGSKTIHIDPDRFPLVRQLFDLMLTGEYTPPTLVEIANNKLGLTTRKGKKVSRSVIYYMFHNPFYYGDFEYPQGSGNWYKGIHKPVITKTEYDRIQTLLTRRYPEALKGTKDLPFRGRIRCGECGASITAEEKTKITKGGNIHHYVYYHCTKRVNPKCTQKCIRAEELEKLLIAGLAEIEVPKLLHVWAIKELRRMNATEITQRAASVGAWGRQLNDTVHTIGKVIDLRANGEITPEMFKDRMEPLKAQKERFESLLASAEKKIDDWIDVAERCFDFAENVRAKFENGGSDTRKHILASLGSNLFLKDKILSIDWVIPFPQIRAMAKEAQAVSERLEPTKDLTKQGYMDEIYSQNPTMLRG